MSRSVYDELLAAGAPALDVDAGEFYRIEKDDDGVAGYLGHVVTIRQRNMKRKHWWQARSYEVWPSKVRIDVGKELRSEEMSSEIDVLATACQISMERIKQQRADQRAIEESDRLLGDHP